MNITIPLGTRPEVIKMAPIILALRQSTIAKVEIIDTGQHPDLFAGAADAFGLVADLKLNVLSENQDLLDLFQRSCNQLRDAIKVSKPDLLLVHGDTTTAAAGAFVGFLSKVHVAHVEAGLRTNDIHSPYPEEFNRRLIDAVSTLHFTPTIKASENLLREGVPKEGIYNVGNSIVDAVNFISGSSDHSLETVLASEILEFINLPFTLVTLHRRENYGEPLDDILEAIVNLATHGYRFILPLHKNPQIRTQILSKLSGVENILLVEALDYIPFIKLLGVASLVITDSGGIQEEAITLGKPLLIAREHTERDEAIGTGLAVLVGNDANLISTEFRRRFNEPVTSAINLNPFGDGKTAEKILKVLKEFDFKKL
jgi:UDP-N-acetylglucosamine 2-epimerase